MTTAVKSLTCREVKAVQEVLGQFIEHPWYDYGELTVLPAHGPEILEQTLRELYALPPSPGRPDLNASRQQSAASLKTLSQSLAAAGPNPETLEYPLTPEQTALYCQAWKSLEKIRRELAVTMFDDLEPYLGVIDTGTDQPGGLNLSVNTHRKVADLLYEEHLAQQRKQKC